MHSYYSDIASHTNRIDGSGLVDPRSSEPKSPDQNVYKELSKL